MEEEENQRLRGSASEQPQPTVDEVDREGGRANPDGLARPSAGELGWTLLYLVKARVLLLRMVMDALMKRDQSVQATCCGLATTSHLGEEHSQPTGPERRHRAQK